MHLCDSSHSDVEALRIEIEPNQSCYYAGTASYVPRTSYLDVLSFYHLVLTEKFSASRSCCTHPQSTTILSTANGFASFTTGLVHSLLSSIFPNYVLRQPLRTRSLLPCRIAVDFCHSKARVCHRLALAQLLCMNVSCPHYTMLMSQTFDFLFV